jgi:transposase
LYFRTKTIKGTPLVQLVESFRNAEGQPRQRVVASLGDADIPEGERAVIAHAVERRIKGESDWCEPKLSASASEWVTRIVQLAGRSRSTRAAVDDETIDGVILDGIETENIVQLGPQLVALQAWEELGFTPMLRELGMNQSRIATAQLMITNRLVEPLSEWALIDWSHRTALPELLDLRITKTTKDRLYQTSDELLGHREAIETRLRHHERDLFSLGRSVILYDVTNTHFEGLCESNPKARHGKNKQKRNDCRQITVGMAFDEHGLPLAHEIFAGNKADTSTLVTLLDRLAPSECDTLKPVVVLDAGFASRGNIEMLRERGYSYLINMTRGSRAKYADLFEEETFESLPNRKPELQVEVKRVIDPEDAESYLVLCRSAQRRNKEKAMMSKAEERFLTDTHALQNRIAKGRLKKSEVIQRKIGALQKKHPRVQRYYTIDYQGDEAGGGLQLQRNEEKIESAEELCGDYVLKTDRDMPADQLWQLYMTLLEAEAGFRMLKSSLGLRPNFHQKEDRVDGHVFISVLAYHLLSWVRRRLDEHGDRREWKTVRRILSTHSLVSTRLPLADGRIVTVRKPSVPDAGQAQLFGMLGIDWKRMCPATKTEIKRQRLCSAF